MQLTFTILVQDSLTVNLLDNRLYMLCICLTFFNNKLTVNPELCYLFITTGAWSWTVPEFQHLRIRCLLGGRPEFLASACCSAYPSWFHDTLDAIVSNWQQKSLFYTTTTGYSSYPLTVVAVVQTEHVVIVSLLDFDFQLTAQFEIRSLKKDQTILSHFCDTVWLKTKRSDNCLLNV